MSDYEYLRLDVEASEIRLLTLLPGPPEAAIRITIDVVVLTKHKIPQFEAVSYAWGSTESTVNIFIDEKNRKRRKFLNYLLQRPAIKKSEATRVTSFILSVTRNLATALRYLRYGDRARVLWIDAICVNQNNLTERSQQVERMADIFARANRVVAWLGPESHDSTLALRSLRHLGSNIVVDWVQRKYTLVSVTQCPESESTDDLITSKFDDATWTSLVSLLNRPWFGRLWIWQEVRLAKKELHLLCGHDDLPWNTFCNAVFFLGRTPGPVMPEMATPRDRPGSWKGRDRAYRLCDPMSHGSLLQALISTKNSECSDNKDKIYAILNLVNQHERRGLKPNYFKSVIEVYQDVILCSLEIQKTLELLIFCELGGPIEDMPTWVPDWSSPTVCNQLLQAKGCLNSEAHGEYVRDGILRVTGICAGTVVRVEDTLLSERPSYQKILAIVNKIKTSIIMWDDYVGGGTMVDAVCRTLCWNRFSDCYIPAVLAFPDYSHSKAFLLDLLNVKYLNYESAGSSMDHRARCYAMAESLHGRSFFVTENGYIGLAPRSIEPGDQVSVLLGCDSPLALRPDKTGRHSVVGQCHIHGLMEGEALLGPLEKMWQCLNRYYAVTGCYWPAFINQETGESQVEDPRLGPLPAGWRICRHKEESAYNVYLDQETGEQTIFDPRMSPQELRARGVKLQDFWLK
ncbi:hypothetical protein IMSHALPRED_000541 [Imshaugia aleurites]|uniref:WW domain-containing protein n=1 Tax=Imshaugia aleurites TaxID=172621 RepID=A0A8H3IZW3_9LECA|nr:hypothetical protein IMSHALPRED_000541 [Imshaugia aleurites]